MELSTLRVGETRAGQLKHHASIGLSTLRNQEAAFCYFSLSPKIWTSVLTGDQRPVRRYASWFMQNIPAASRRS